MNNTGPITRLADGASIQVLRTAPEIGRDAARIGSELSSLARGRVPVMIGLLKGSFIFLADLVRSFGGAHEIEFLAVTRYDPANHDPSSVRVLHDLSRNIAGRLVVVVEGIRTQGTKIEYVDRFLRLHEPEEILYAAMVRQRASAGGPVPLHAWGFEIDDEYVIGYGLDLEERYRNLPFIGVREEPVESGGAG